MKKNPFVMSKKKESRNSKSALIIVPLLVLSLVLISLTPVFAGIYYRVFSDVTMVDVIFYLDENNGKEINLTNDYPGFGSIVGPMRYTYNVPQHDNMLLAYYASLLEHEKETLKLLIKQERLYRTYEWIFYFSPNKKYARIQIL